MNTLVSQFARLFESITQAAGQPVYLVGGAVRDAMLGRVSNDLDFVLEKDARAVGKRVANALNGGFYMLDQARDTARVIIQDDQGRKQYLDFATFRGENLEADLRDRDFTINALALDLGSQQLIDPTGGAADLRQRQVRLCAPGSLESDPVRTMRAIRLSLALDLRILPETAAAMRAAAPKLARVSPERQRDELFRMFDGSRVNTAVHLMDRFGLLQIVLPELEDLKGVTQSAPHVYDVWEHTLTVIQQLEDLLEVLAGDQERAANIHASTVLLFLRRYRDRLREHYRGLLTPGRTPRALLFLAALYHDISKPEARSVEESGRIRFFEHEHIGAQVMEERARGLALSTAEVQRAVAIVKNHMRVHHLAAAQLPPSRRAVYRFFKATGQSGPDIIVLSLADVMGTYAATLDQQTLENELTVARTLLDGLWQTPHEVVRPPRLLDGQDLQTHFDLKPGRKIGELLEELQEAQAMGDISSREDALRFIEERLNHDHS
ncbi:MAG TPA: HD domain-containing protein [Anaerolineaceae bacterium]